MILHITDVSKAYGSLSVLSHVTLELLQDESYCLMSPSGTGKTTLLRILMGLEAPDSGRITLEREGRLQPAAALRIAAVFQEDRLCEALTPLENAAMAIPGRADRSALRREMSRILPAECLDRPVSTLSGGMKRRTAILRALLSPSHMLLMDEPFTGLDEAIKAKVIQEIRRLRRDRFLLITTHQEEDAALLSARLLQL